MFIDIVFYKSYRWLCFSPSKKNFFWPKNSFSRGIFNTVKCYQNVVDCLPLVAKSMKSRNSCTNICAKELIPDLFFLKNSQSLKC